NRYTLTSIVLLEVSMHTHRKSVKRQEMLFILQQAKPRFRIALSILGLEGGQVDECLLLGRLFPDATQLCLNVSTFPPRDGVEHIALLVHQTATTRRC